MKPVKFTSRGITLIELLVTLAIFSILTAAAMPFFKSIFNATDLNSAKNAVIYSVNKAKSMANSENTFVEMQFEGSKIQIKKNNTGDSELVEIPKTIIFLATTTITFSPTGIIINGNGGDTNISFQHNTTPELQETIAITTTGLVAEAGL